jgi:pimeloyl-ACP methyl ester carboxylesterase
MVPPTKASGLNEASWTQLAREIGKYEAIANGELHAWHFRAEGQATATLVCLHGIQTHGAWFAPLAQKLTSHGYSLWCPDRRGSGMSPSLNEGARIADIESARIWLDDIDKVVAVAAGEGAPVFLVGTSWGARPALAYAQEQGSKGKVKAVALVAPAFWTTADSLIGLWFAPLLRWFGLSTGLEKRLPPEIYLPKTDVAREAVDAANFLTQMRLDDSRLVKRVTFRALDEASRLSKIALRNRPPLPATVFFDEQDALVKQPKSKERLADLGIPSADPTNAGHGVQVISSDELADVLRSWLEKQQATH